MILTRVVNRYNFVLYAAISSLTAVPLTAEEQFVGYNTYGAPGLIDMPTAQSAPDAELATTISRSNDTTRTTLSFQILPRLSGSFRYSSISPWHAATGEATFDRSFDLSYRLADETRFRPSVKIGLRDLIGTGIYSGEYIVATKQFTPDVSVTGGIGWGRLGSHNGFRNPLGVFNEAFDTRPSGTTGTGGQFESAKWFRGEAAFFGGVAWQATDRLTLKAEYSSDAYSQELERGAISINSPYNFGLDYRISEGINAQAHYLYGSQVGIGVTLSFNPKSPGVYGGGHQAPFPVNVRAKGGARTAKTKLSGDSIVKSQADLRQLLQAEGLHFESVRLSESDVTVYLRNPRFDVEAEAIGRTARILTRTMPDSVENFHIVPVVNGLPMSEVSMRRSDIEKLEHDPDAARQSFTKAKIEEVSSQSMGFEYDDDEYPKLNWGIGPYVALSFFDPDSPVYADVGLQLSASYDINPGLVVSGRIRKPLVNNRTEDIRLSDSVLPHVRSDAVLYANESNFALSDLTVSQYFRPGPELYGRITAGYLEPMFGGVSTELLWKPVDSNFGLGAELNYVRQRDFDQLFGFQDYEIVSGHVSAYLNLGQGFRGQLDAGRYLAGDWGATFALDRTFKNGWKVGAYATLTDVSFEDFGEGSFDKGLRISIPVGSVTGQPTRQTAEAILQPLSRDGGAKLKVQGRLFEKVNDYHSESLKDGWGRFWR